MAENNNTDKDSLFRKLQLAAQARQIPLRTAQSRKWFNRKASRVRSYSRREILNDPALKRVPESRLMPGKMYMYFYNPKTANTLPYYDLFPLILMVGPAENGWYGLNLHYLSPFYRARFLDKLMGITTNDRFDETTRIKMSYNLLSSSSKYKEFAPCFKHYLSEHVSGRLTLVPSSEWEIAIYLPTERFVKSSKNKVWAESRRSIS